MIEKPDDIKSIDDRIQKIKNKEEMDNKHSDFSNWAIGLQISIELVSGVIVGYGVGYILNEIFDLNDIFVICLTILGGIAGFFNVERYLKKPDNEKTKR